MRKSIAIMGMCLFLFMPNLVSLGVQAQAPSGVESRDLRVEKVLKAEKMIYSVRNSGLYSIRVNYTDVNRHQVAYVDSKTELYQGYETRMVWSTIYEGPGPLKPGIATKLLTTNAKFGGWRIEEVDGTMYLFFATHVPATCTGVTLKAAINMVLLQADTAEHELFGTDTF